MRVIDRLGLGGGNLPHMVGPVVIRRMPYKGRRDLVSIEFNYEWEDGFMEMYSEGLLVDRRLNNDSLPWTKIEKLQKHVGYIRRVLMRACGLE